MAIELKLSPSLDTASALPEKGGSPAKGAAANGAGGPASNFTALLAQFDGLAGDAAVPLAATDTKTALTTDLTPDLAERTILSGGKDGLAVSGEVLDPSSLMAQMQVGWGLQQCAQTLAIPSAPGGKVGKTGLNVNLTSVPSNSVAVPTGATEAETGVKAAAFPVSGARQPNGLPLVKAKDVASVASGSLQSNASETSTKLLPDLQAAVSTTQGHTAMGKQTPSMMGVQGAASAFLKAEKSSDNAVVASATTVLGESFRQWAELTKPEKSAEGGLQISHTGTAVRTDSPAVQGWSFAATTSLATPGAGAAATPFGVDQQIANQVSLWVGQNIQSAELKLDALGPDPVEVSIALTGNEAQIQFRSDVAETRELLTRSATQLDSALQREGLVLSGVSVGTSGQGQDEARQAAENARHSGTSAQRGTMSAQTDEVRMSVVPRVTRGAVDLFV